MRNRGRTSGAAMPAPPVFNSMAEFRSRLTDVAFWRPYVSEVLQRHAPAAPAGNLQAGGGTYPTFLCGELVVKLFGGWQTWRQAHATERSALAALARAATSAAPQLLAAGRLGRDDRAPWPYLVTSRVPGKPWGKANPSKERQLSLAAELGRQVRRVQALRPAGLPPSALLPPAQVADAARASALPAHLVAQVEGYVARLGPLDGAFVHGDLMHRHLFVADGRLTGIIDWGDAACKDRHYELAKLHLDLFDCDQGLLRAFLQASHWPLTPGFPHKALALALHRQADGLMQHFSMDVFHKLPSLLPLQDIRTLDELATALFAP